MYTINTTKSPQFGVNQFGTNDCGVGIGQLSRPLDFYQNTASPL